MIITQLKDIDEIYEMIKPYDKILIAGCDGCCQPPRSLNEAKTLGQLLELKARTESKTLKWKAITVLRQCDDRIAATTVGPHAENYGETGGICPRAGCAKHLSNGPCGGMVDGMCEVGGYTIPCAWVRMWTRLKEFDRLDLFKKYRPPRDYRTSSSPGYIPIYKEYGNEKEEEQKEEVKA
jgi:hypothetical protein